MKRFFFMTIVFVWCLCGCQAQTMEDQIKQVKATSDKIIVAIENNDEKSFKSLIGMDLSNIAKSPSMLRADFKKMNLFYKKYIEKQTKLHVIVTEEFTELGKLKVIIPFYKGCDSIENIKLVQLELLFGPPDFVPLSGISGYKIVVESCKDTLPELIMPDTLIRTPRRSNTF